MSISYYNVFRQKTGQNDSDVEEEVIDPYLDQAAFLVSIKYATPWASFDDVTTKYKYGVTLLACIEYWWTKASEYAIAADSMFVQGGTTMGQKSESVFTKSLKMIALLSAEISELDIVVEGSGDIIVGDLIRRSKRTGLLVPNSDDANGNWLS